MASGTHNKEFHAEHHIPLQTYFVVLGTLLALTVVTVAAARFDFGAFNTIIALGIASIKAGLVLAYFMHLKFDSRIYLAGFFISIFFLLLLYFVAALDVFTQIPVRDIL